ncbi:hypothetical protein D9757_000146 [Collybiopsis confluens]|uniref:Uncharacterized protein n=1 Tax=Collybiopsis confluens TaxID=2823264 RepID=A0A8H5MHG2_9AGAR|nr:hypothetical protein D9757_000146 [Collybiopsis confluens]
MSGSSLEPRVQLLLTFPAPQDTQHQGQESVRCKTKHLNMAPSHSTTVKLQKVEEQEQRSFEVKVSWLDAEDQSNSSDAKTNDRAFNSGNVKKVFDVRYPSSSNSYYNDAALLMHSTFHAGLVNHVITDKGYIDDGGTDKMLWLATTTFHVPFILALPSLFNLHSVLERNPPTPSGTVIDKFHLPPSVILYRSLDEALADPLVELVFIGTPNDTHYTIVKAALEAGKHVLVDKPVTPTTVEAVELGNLAKAQGKVLYAFQNRRFDQDYLALKKLLDLPETDEMSLGTVIEFESQYKPGLKGSWKDEPRPAAGLLYDLGSHLIDQALSLFGRPTKLTAFISNLRGIGHPDFTVYMHYPAGSALPYPFTAILRAHPLSARSPQIRFLIRGQKGSYTKYGIDVQEDQLKGLSGSTSQSVLASIQNDAVFGVESESAWGVIEHARDANASITKSAWPSKDPGCYADLFRNLADAIRNKGELKVKWEEATAVIEMIELSKKSAKEGKTLDVPHS